MYIYDALDQQLAEQRVAQFKDQTRRFLAGELGEEAFRVLRLQNGLYLQRHAPMLRVAIPYGLLSSAQLRTLARIARRWDKGYAHLGTRQNVQFNWLRLEDVPQILFDLATVQMRATQSGGNRIGNITSDLFAGIAPDELVNPLAWCEIIREWSVLNPEFARLPRKFTIAVSAAPAERAGAGVYDIGLQAAEQDGGIGFRVQVGSEPFAPFVAWPHLLTCLDAILRVYKLHGQRDNKYRARIGVLAEEFTPDGFWHQVELQWRRLRDGPGTLSAHYVADIARRFIWPDYSRPEPGGERADRLNAQHAQANADFARWLLRNVHPHKAPGYAAVTVLLRASGVAPGDITADQMDAVAELAERYGFGELRVSHEQNLIMADIRRRDLFALWQQLDLLHLAAPDAGTPSGIAACHNG
jgi:sulfite reductase (NADPH) hemoprotein beta-component